MRFLLQFLAALAVAQLVSVDTAPRISQDEFKTLHTAGGVIVVDTRTVDAYRLGHIPGAVLLPVEGLQVWPREYEEVAVMLQGAKKPIVTYCA